MSVALYNRVRLKIYMDMCDIFENIDLTMLMTMTITNITTATPNTTTTITTTTTTISDY